MIRAGPVESLSYTRLTSSLRHIPMMAFSFPSLLLPMAKRGSEGARFVCVRARFWRYLMKAREPLPTVLPLVRTLIRGATLTPGLGLKVAWSRLFERKISVFIAHHPPRVPSRLWEKRPIASRAFSPALPRHRGIARVAAHHPARAEMTAETIPSPAPAPESSGAGAPAAAKRVPLTIKVCHAWSNHWSVEHLVHRRVVEVAEDGSDTLASVKDAFAEIEGVPVDMVMFMWMDRPIGRCAGRGASTVARTTTTTTTTTRERAEPRVVRTRINPVVFFFRLS